MSDELRLILCGFSLEQAITACWALRKEGTLEAFIEEQEKRNNIERPHQTARTTD